MSNSNNAGSYVACVPHVPLLVMQKKENSQALWQAYNTRIEEFNAFDPEVVFVFGGDHYSNIHLNLMPTFMVGHKAEAIDDDCGGSGGTLDVPLDISRACADYLMTKDFDIATSYDMKVDHGFSAVIANFFDGVMSARPVVPVFLNTVSRPRPTMKRCRELGAAIGEFAKTLNKRVAFLGSGGLSHQTNFIFPEYEDADPEVRDFIVTGGKGTIKQDKWHGDIDIAMQKLSGDLISGEFKAPWINKEWDMKFMNTLEHSPLESFDDWDDDSILEAAGYGGGEVRMWISAIAAAKAMGTGKIIADYYSDKDPLGIGVGICHAQLD